MVIFLSKSLWKCCHLRTYYICNQCEIQIRYALDFQVMDLLRSMVNVKAKNLDGETAMDILETYNSPSGGCTDSNSHIPGWF